jgi:signal transduction histidine kinase
MENARLITETREALDQQTATAEVLGVINSSPGDLAPVFDAMLERATRLCEAVSGFLWTYDGERFQTAAMRGLPPSFAEFLREPRTPGPETGIARLAQGEPLVHFTDLAAITAYKAGEPPHRASIDLGGFRTVLVVPLRKDDTLLGGFTVNRQEVRPFTDKQIALLQNFAAQAVIAMENARLITETRERTRDLQESLEYQTATSDVLKVISQSDADLNTVLQTVLDTAAGLCEADGGNIFLRRGEQLQLMASIGASPQARADLAAHPLLVDRRSTSGRAVLTGQAIHITDITADPDYTHASTMAAGIRTMLGVPLLREDNPIGSLSLARYIVRPFTHKQIELVRTFADQAAIAIENARLLGELRTRTDELGRSVEELKALSEVGQAVSSTLDLGAVLSTVLNRSVGLTEADAGVIFRYSERRHAFRLAEAVGWDAALVKQVRDMRIDQGATLMGEAVTHRAPAQIADLRERPSNVLRDATLAAGYRSVLVVPLVGADRIFGALLLQRRRPGEFPEAEVRLMQTLAAQSVLAIQNAGLFREIADKSEELRLASQHKSQFLANMSHELRTPLNAILGYSELLVDGIYGAVPERAMGVLERVQNNGKHLLALINDVLDLSKIEAGQLVLTLEDYALPDVVQSVVSATEGLATTKGLKFSADVAAGLPTGHGDARRLSQVLLNLVGNAVKFTDEGEVAIGAMAENGHFVLTVRDTGPGIAPQDHDKIFGEFQQVDNSNTRKKGGTGLGLAISKRMVEMQGGSIMVESELGHGATFRVTLPIRVEHADELTGELMGAA